MRGIVISIAAGLLFGGIWLARHPPLPQHPTGDVFTSLATARHLVRGNGLLNDTIYPLFTAYPWGHVIPQPLVHRAPGLAVLLVPAWLLSGGDSAQTEQLVRPVMLCVLCLLAMLGTWALHRLGSLPATGAWLLLLLFSPWLALGVNWGWSEVPAGLALLGLWLVIRRRAPCAMTPLATAGYAGLAASLALVRQDLLWIPIFWWCAAAAVQRRGASHIRSRGRSWRRTALAAFVGAVLLAPWWAHVARHTGAPWKNPMADAVQLDLSANWWDYTTLRSRTPLPLTQNLAENTVPALRKIRSGIRHYATTLREWLPWPVWLALAVLWSMQTRRRLQRGRWWPAAIGPPALLAATLVLCVLQYAFLAGLETRHMLPLLPLFAWEAALLADRRMRMLTRRLWTRGVILPAAAGLALVVASPGLEGLAGNVTEALDSVGKVAETTAAAAAELPPGPLFCDNAVVPWRLDRPFIWNPLNEAVEAEIRQIMPAMRDAPWVRLHGETDPAAPVQNRRSTLPSHHSAW